MGGRNHKFKGSDTEMKNYNKGFIQIPILIAIILGTLLIGGASYVGVQKIYSPTEDVQLVDSQETEEIEILRKEIEDLKTQQAEQGAKNNEQPKVIERIIERTVPATQTQPTQTPVVETVNKKENEIQSFNTFWNNSQKAWEEMNRAKQHYTDSLNAMNSGSGTVSIAYAQNAIDSCSSAHQLNLNNQTPNLPFSEDLSNVNKVISTLALKCKQASQISLEGYKKWADAQSESYSLSARIEFTAQAQTLGQQSYNLFMEYSDIWSNQLIPATTKAIKSSSEYFK